MYHAVFGFILLICMASIGRAASTTVPPKPTSVSADDRESLKVLKKGVIKFVSNEQTEGHDVVAKTLLFSNDGRLLTVGTSLFHRGGADGNETLIDGYKYSVFDVSDSANPVLVGNYTVKYFDKNKQYSADGQTLTSVDFNGHLRIENPGNYTAAPRLLATLQAPQVTPSSFAISKDGRYMAVGSKQGALYIYDLKQVDRPQRVSQTNTSMPINSIALSEDQKWGVMLGVTGQFKIYNLTDLEVPSEVAHTVYSNSTQQLINGFLLDTDFKWLVIQGYGFSSSDEKVMLIYDLEQPASPQLLFDSYADSGVVVSTFDISPDRKLIAAVVSEITEAKVEIWPSVVLLNVTNPKLPTEVNRLDDKWYTNVAFNPVKAMLAAMDSEEQVTLYQYDDFSDDSSDASTSVQSKSIVMSAILFVLSLVNLSF